MTTPSITNAVARAAAPVLRVRGLTKRRGAFVLGPIDLSVAEGGALAVLGANGSGKTTLFGCLAGVVRLDAGRVEVADLQAGAVAGARATVGYLADPPPFFDRWSGARNLAFLERVCPTWSQSVAIDLIEALDVDLSAPVRRLSKGTRAKLGVVAVLAQRPSVALLDEPTSGLDPLARRALWGAVAAHRARWGTTVVFASHDVADVERNADAVLVLRAGRAVLHATPNVLGGDGVSFSDAIVEALRPTRAATAVVAA